MKTMWTAGAVAAIAAGQAVAAQSVQVTFENLSAADGTAFTPVFFGLHDGSYDLFSPGAPVSAGLELVAEVGQTGTLDSEFNASPGAIDSGTTTGGPVIGGQATTLTLDAGTPTGGVFLSFATMVVPTNDLFIGNPNQTGIRVFNDDGTFAGPFTIEIFGSQVWDAGTELNNADDGAAFLDGIDGSLGTTEGGTASLFFDDPNAAAYLASLEGRTTAPGFVIDSTFAEATPIARITVVPTPGAAAVLALAGVATVRRRRG